MILDESSHVMSIKQIISEQRRYSTLKFVYEIASLLMSYKLSST